MSIETQTTNGNNHLYEIGSAQIILKDKQDGFEKELGFARAVSFTYEQQVIEVLADNGDLGLKGFTGSKAAINFTLLENDTHLMRKILGSSVDYEQEDGTTSKNFIETFNISNYQSTENRCVSLVNAGSSLGAPVISSVNILDEDGTLVEAVTPLSSNKGYFIYKSSLGYYAICISGDFGTSEFTLEVIYDVIPLKSRSTIIKETGFFPELYLILKTRMYNNFNEDSYVKEYHFPKVKFNGSLQATFKSKREGDFVKEIPIIFQALPHQYIKSDKSIVTAVCIEKELLN